MVDEKRCLELLDFGWNTVSYDPYDVDHWVLSSVPYDEYVDTAEWCDVWCDEVCGDVLAYNLKYLQVTA